MFGFHGSLRVFSVGLLGLSLTGCLSKEEIRRIESRPEGTGITLSRLPEMIRILATYEATPAQRDGAQRKAEKLQRQLETVLAEKPATVGKPAPVEKPPSVEVPTTAKMPRYLAVPVEPDERKQGAEQMMIWDTQSSNFIDNSVYDVAETPEDGVEMKWETSSATLAVTYLGKEWTPRAPGS